MPERPSGPVVSGRPPERYAQQGIDTSTDAGGPVTLEATGSCFGCGERNPGGLRLCFEVDRAARTLRTTCRLPDIYQSWEGILHGGLVATLLDEAMGKLAQELGHPALTASLEVRFRRPARVGEPITVEAAIDSLDRRIIRARARAFVHDRGSPAPGRCSVPASPGAGGLPGARAEGGHPGKTAGAGAGGASAGWPTAGWPGTLLAEATATLMPARSTDGQEVL